MGAPIKQYVQFPIIHNRVPRTGGIATDNTTLMKKKEIQKKTNAPNNPIIPQKGGGFARKRKIYSQKLFPKKGRKNTRLIEAMDDEGGATSHRENNF